MSKFGNAKFRNRHHTSSLHLCRLIISSSIFHHNSSHFTTRAYDFTQLYSQGNYSIERTTTSASNNCDPNSRRMSAFGLEPTRSDVDHLLAHSTDGRNHIANGRNHDTIAPEMSKMASQDSSSPTGPVELSVSQKMLSATWGSVLTSLLGKRKKMAARTQ